MFIVYFRPFNDGHLDIFNECCIIIVLYGFFCLTDFVTDLMTIAWIGDRIV